MEPAMLGWDSWLLLFLFLLLLLLLGGAWFGADVGARGVDFVSWLVVRVSELDLAGEDRRLWGLLVLVLVLLVVLLPGAALLLRPLRYSSAGFRKIPVAFWTMSDEVPSNDDVVPVTGSQR